MKSFANLFGGKARKNKVPAAFDTVTGLEAAEESPYVAARREWNERYGDYIAQKRSWQLVALALIAVLGVSVAGNVYQGTQSKIQPFLVEVNQMGEPLRVRPAEKGDRPNAKMIAAQVARFIMLTRSVTTDGYVQKRWLDEAYSMVTAAADGFLNEYYKDHDPFAVAKQGQRVIVTVQRPMPLSEKTWNVEWEEERRGQQGELISRQRFKALVPVLEFVPEKVEQLMANPAGVLIDVPSWSQLL
uniref:conjugal transfer protein TrbF n=1 Tax=Cupriavidus gilardii TaxID=82541 RepID=UPI002479F1A1|nr:conjugal transfer protein TrbF [Cupriavidus gilardii]WDE72632.1 Conjugative transfer protein TrbF [Cupriavidus gilardii]